jgi:hypothetical protein
MGMVNLDKPVNSLTKEDCLFILKEHIGAFGYTLTEYYSCQDGDLLIDILNRLDEITEEIQPRILWVLTKKPSLEDHINELILPNISELNTDEYKIDGDTFIVDMDEDDILELTNSYAVIISDDHIELFVDDGNTKTYKERVTNALTGLREFFCTKVILYP